MQLRRKIVYITLIFTIMIAIVGGINLWVMRRFLFEHQQIYGYLDGVLSKANSLIIWFIVEAIAIIGLNMFVVMFHCRRLSLRVREMKRILAGAGSGQLDIRAAEDAEDELDDLARAMNETAEYLAKTREELEQSRKALALQLKEQKATEAQLAEAATRDLLTGLPNRASFFEQCNHAIALAERQQRELALLFIDMDGLKTVNDAFGHDGGDVLIQQVAERLQGNVRKSDYVSRLAGDEFVVILEHIHDGIRDVSFVCKKLLLVLAEPYDIRGRRIKLTASIGVSLFPDHGSCADELLHKADSAMYRVKNSGKNNFAIYAPLETQRKS